MLESLVLAWNRRLTQLVYDARTNLVDINIIYFDLHDVFDQIIDKPHSFPQTALYKNTTSACDAYMPSYEPKPKGTFDPSCGVSLDEYFWNDHLHPTYPAFDAIASKIAETLRDPDSV